jgi:NADH-quinone oxidoreductase subunit L
MAWAWYVRDEEWPKQVAAPVRPLQPLLEGKWYVDEVYNMAVVGPLKAASGWFARIFDPKVIDGMVNAVGEVTNDAGQAVRKLQNGAVPTYAFSIFLGVVAVVLYFIFAH